ncbi:hypothetical protein Peur_020556 [Populus x canadensis]
MCWQYSHLFIIFFLILFISHKSSAGILGAMFRQEGWVAYTVGSSINQMPSLSTLTLENCRYLNVIWSGAEFEAQLIVDKPVQIVLQLDGVKL